LPKLATVFIPALDRSDQGIHTTEKCTRTEKKKGEKSAKKKGEKRTWQEKCGNLSAAKFNFKCLFSTRTSAKGYNLKVTTNSVTKYY